MAIIEFCNIFVLGFQKQCYEFNHCQFWT